MNNLTNTLFNIWIAIPTIFLLTTKIQIYLNYYTNLPKILEISYKILEFLIINIIFKQKFIRITKVYTKTKIRKENNYSINFGL